MSRLFFVFILFFASSTTIAQLTKGNWLTGGTGTLYSYNGTYSSPTLNNESEHTEIDLSATLGYFVADKIAFGLRPGFSSLKGEVKDFGRTNMQRFAIGPFGRYYFLNSEKPFNIVSDVCYQFGVNDWHGQSGKIRNLSFMAGPVLYFNSAVGLEFLLGYSSRTEDIKNVYKDTRKGFQTSIGFQIHLEKD